MPLYTLGDARAAVHQDALEDAALVRYATQLGIAVRGTPALFINGLRYRGNRDMNALDAALRHPSVGYSSDSSGGSVVEPNV